jgi:hypothetical protein
VHVSPAAHVGVHTVGAMHVPPTHVCPAAHRLPHAPQLFVSVIVAVHTFVQHDAPDAHVPPPQRQPIAVHVKPVAHAGMQVGPASPPASLVTGPTSRCTPVSIAGPVSRAGPVSCAGPVSVRGPASMLPPPPASPRKCPPDAQPSTEASAAAPNITQRLELQRRVMCQPSGETAP